MRTENVSSPDQPAPNRPPTRAWRRHRPATRLAAPDDLRTGSGTPARNLYTIVLIDVAESANYSSLGQRKVRVDLYDLVASLVEYGGCPLRSLPTTDLGDGLRVLIPLDRIEPARVVDMFVLGLAAGLREHRRLATDNARIRLRVAFDLGLVEPNLHSWSGDPLVRVARLVDADPMRQLLRADRSLDLAAVVSDMLYDSVVRHGYGYIGAACFQPIRVRVKEFDTRAWLLSRRAVGLCGSCDCAA